MTKKRRLRRLTPEEKMKVWSNTTETNANVGWHHYNWHGYKCRNYNTIVSKASDSKGFDPVAYEYGGINDYPRRKG